MLDPAVGVEPKVDALQVFRVTILVVLIDRPGNEVSRLHKARGLGIDVQGHLDEAVERSQSFAPLPLGHECLKKGLIAGIIGDDEGAVGVTLTVETAEVLVEPRKDLLMRPFDGTDWKGRLVDNDSEVARFTPRR